jgi:(2Fe-2S) ferredoxin
VRRECPGRCEQGPTMRIAPSASFFTEIDDAAPAVIIDEIEKTIELQYESGS